MKRILYGVSGEGAGHSSRARVIIKYLENQGHKVKVLSYDRGLKNLRSDFDVEEVFGLQFSFFRNRVEPIGTAYKNIIKSPKAIKSIARVNSIVKEFKPDIVFSDFEPISSIVATMKKLSLVSIDNVHQVTNIKVKYPSKYTGEALFAKTVIKLMLVNPKEYLVTSFFNEPAKGIKTEIIPPIIRDKVLNLKTGNSKHILVYISSEFKDIVKVLKQVNKTFVVYGFNKDAVEENVTFKKASQEGFLADLATSEAVIANSGFTLITEALHLKKPYLAVPIKGHFEQILNAVYLEKLGYGKYWSKLNKERIESFLFNIKDYKSNLEEYQSQDNSETFKKIEEVLKRYA